MSRANLVVIGGANTDYIMRGERLPEKGESVSATELVREAGGKGLNQAIAAARLGARVAFIGMVGSDRAGEYILARLLSEGVDVRHVVRHHVAPTGSTLIMVDERGDTKRMAAAGANALLQPADVMRAIDTIRQAELVLAQLEVPLTSVECAFRLAYGHGLTTVLDAAPAQPVPDELLRMTSVLRANEREATRITGIPVKDEASAARAAACLIARGAGVAALATGAGSDIVVADDASIVFPHQPVKIMDRTGAGDAYSAAFAVGIMEGRSLRDAGFLASAAAALAMTRLGTLDGLPDRHKLNAFIQANGKSM